MASREKAQLNLKVPRSFADRFRKFCEREPVEQSTLFVDLVERYWETLKRERGFVLKKARKPDLPRSVSMSESRSWGQRDKRIRRLKRILETRGDLPAAYIAEKLGVSVRTIYNYFEMIGHDPGGLQRAVERKRAKKRKEADRKWKQGIKGKKASKKVKKKGGGKK